MAANSQIARSSGLASCAAPVSASTRQSRRQPAWPLVTSGSSPWPLSRRPEVSDAASAPGSATSTTRPSAVQARASAKPGRRNRRQAPGSSAGSSTITVLPVSSRRAVASTRSSGAKARLVSGMRSEILAGCPASGPYQIPDAAVGPARPAVTTNAAASPAAVTAMRSGRSGCGRCPAGPASVRTNSRVEHDVEHVHREVGEHHERGDQHHDADDHRQVLLGDRLDGQLAEAGQAEYVLCYHGPAEQYPDVDAELSHHR